MKITTPKGTAQYPWLNTPDTKFSEHGDYKVNLIVPADQAKDFVAKVTAARKQAAIEEKAKKLAPLPFDKEVDDQGNETGNVVIKCKVANKVSKRTGEVWDRRPALFDARLNPINDKVGGGSEIKLSCELYFWKSPSLGMGVSIQPLAVQVLKLVELSSGASADDFGFEAEEGFTGEFTEDTDGAPEVLSAQGEDEDLF